MKIEAAAACALGAVPLIVKEEGPEWGDMYQMLVEIRPRIMRILTPPRRRNKIYLAYPKGTYALSIAKYNLWSRVNVCRLKFRIA